MFFCTCWASFSSSLTLGLFLWRSVAVSGQRAHAGGPGDAAGGGGRGRGRQRGLDTGGRRSRGWVLQLWDRSRHFCQILPRIPSADFRRIRAVQEVEEHVVVHVLLALFGSNKAGRALDGVGGAAASTGCVTGNVGGPSQQGCTRSLDVSRCSSDEARRIMRGWRCVSFHRGRGNKLIPDIGFLFVGRWKRRGSGLVLAQSSRSSLVHLIQEVFCLSCQVCEPGHLAPWGKNQRVQMGQTPKCNYRLKLIPIP